MGKNGDGNNGKDILVLVPGLRPYINVDNLYKDPVAKSLRRHERRKMTGIESYKQKNDLAWEKTKTKYFILSQESE